MDGTAISDIFPKTTSQFLTILRIFPARVSNYVDILAVGHAALIYICTLLFSFRFRLTLSQFIYFGARESCILRMRS